MVWDRRFALGLRRGEPIPSRLGSWPPPSCQRWAQDAQVPYGGSNTIEPEEMGQEPKREDEQL